VYCAIVVIWIALPAYLATVGCLGTDIIKGTCIPWGAFISYAAERTINFSFLIFTYTFPMMTMMFLYARVIHTLKIKVTSPVNVINDWRNSPNELNAENKDIHSIVELQRIVIC